MKHEIKLQQESPVFKSFFMGGFECAFASIEQERKLDLLKESKHDVYCREDYALLKEIGIFTVREGMGWRVIDQGKGKYDFARFEKMMAIGREEGVEQIWDLSHFDYPLHLDPFKDEFIEAFAEYAKRAAKILRKYNDGVMYIVPMNEISFFSHMAATIALWAPYVLTNGYVFKQQLVKATIAGMEAIWEIDSNVRFIQVDPIFRRVAKQPATDVMRAIVAMFMGVKFQTFDMLCGKLDPHLGGKPKYLDIIGGNYYNVNQEWITGDDVMDMSCHEVIPMGHKDRVSLHSLLSEVHDRYKRPMVLTETGAYGDLRAEWWQTVLKEIDYSKGRLPLHGVCAYPVIDRHDWSDGHITNSGLWDFKKGDKEYKRIPHGATINIVREYIEKIETQKKRRDTEEEKNNEKK